MNQLQTMQSELAAATVSAPTGVLPGLAFRFASALHMVSSLELSSFLGVTTIRRPLISRLPRKGQ